MSLPTAVFLDTSVLAGQQYNFSSTALSSFIPLAKKHSLRILLPAPTESEILRQIKDRSQEALKALEDARRRAPFLAKWQHFPPKTTSWVTDWEVSRLARDEWQAFLRNFDLVRLDYSSVNLATVMQWYDRAAAPFREGKKRKEFPDAFSVAIIEAYARKTGDSVAVVSEDGDFKLACDRFSSLLYFRSLPALTELLLSDDAKLSAIHHSILDDISAVEHAAVEAAKGLEYFHSDRDYKIGQTNVHGITLDDVRVVALGADECTLTFTGELEAEHHLQWEEIDQYREDYVTEEQWVLESAKLSGTAKVLLDPKTIAIQDISFFELDDRELEVTENPRRRW